jgi:two-component system, LytTR family, response regulator
MINCIIVDDEQFSVDALTRYAERIPFLNVVLATTSPKEASRVVYEQPIDLVFTDVFMPEMTGVELVQMLGNKCKVIFITAYSDYAVQGYEFGVIDYLMKPVFFEKFLKATQKAETLIELEKKSIEKPVNQPIKDYFMVKTGQKGTLAKVKYTDVLFIEGAENYVNIWTINQEKLMTAMTLKALEEELPKDLFMRVHKSNIIALSHITGLSGGEVMLDGVSVPLGVTYRDIVLKHFSDRVV